MALWISKRSVAAVSWVAFPLFHPQREQGQDLKGQFEPKPRGIQCSVGRIQPTEPCMSFFTWVQMSSPALTTVSHHPQWNQPGHMPTETRSITHTPLTLPIFMPQSVCPGPPLSLCTCRVSQDSEVMRGGAARPTAFLPVDTANWYLVQRAGVYSDPRTSEQSSKGSRALAEEERAPQEGSSFPTGR